MRTAGGPAQRPLVEVVAQVQHRGQERLQVGAPAQLRACAAQHIQLAARLSGGQHTRVDVITKPPASVSGETSRSK